MGLQSCHLNKVSRALSPYTHTHTLKGQRLSWLRLMEKLASWGGIPAPCTLREGDKGGHSSFQWVTTLCQTQSNERFFWD